MKKRNGLACVVLVILGLFLVGARTKWEEPEWISPSCEDGFTVVVYAPEYSEAVMWGNGATAVVYLIEEWWGGEWLSYTLPYIGALGLGEEWHVFHGEGAWLGNGWYEFIGGYVVLPFDRVVAMDGGEWFWWGCRGSVWMPVIERGR